MATRTEVIALPACRLTEVHQTGATLATAHAGATLSLFYATIETKTPHGAELASDDGELSAEIGLQWGGADGKTLVDYDGVFELPDEIADALRARGFRLSDEELETATCSCGVQFAPTFGEFHRCPSCLSRQHSNAELETL